MQWEISEPGNILKKEYDAPPILLKYQALKIAVNILPLPNDH